jgi:polyhydroxybutyrate depolymerase
MCVTPAHVCGVALLLAAHVLPLASAGVTASAVPPSAPTAACWTLSAGDQTIRFEVDGTTREVLVHVPPLSRRPVTGMPLVIAFHGYSATARQLADTALLDPIADEDGFAVAYPQGAGAVATWAFPGGPTLPSDGVDDIRFMEALLDRVTAEGCVDTGRVIAMGHSMGGGMAEALACELADRLAGAVLVSAVRFGIPCSPARPIPVLALHALDDDVLPYWGGHIPGTPTWYPDVEPVERAMADWAARNGCAAGPIATDGPDGGWVLDWDGCSARVALHRLASGGHAYAHLASLLVRDLVRWVPGAGWSPSAGTGPPPR